MPRIYSQTTATAGSTSVHVKQVLGSSRPQTVAYIAQVVTTSQMLIKKVLTLKRDWTEDPVFLKYFHPEDSLDASMRGGTWAEAETSARTVFSNLWKVYVGVTKEHSVKVADLGTDSGYVSVYTGRGTQGDIHIHRKFIGDDWGNAVLTYIHEASHKFAGTKDHGKQGYINGKGEYKEPGLTSLQASVNADSYAWFVWGCGSREEKWTVPTV
jgi:hypothetical protein